MSGDLREKARAFARRDDWTAARLYFEKLAADEPGNALAHACLGFFCLKETRYDTKRALAELDEALRLDPACALAHVYRAITLACLQDGAAARAAGDEARRCGAKPEDYTAAQAYIELDTGSLDAAIARFRALAGMEGDSTSQILLSQALSQAGQNEAALECARKACALDPNDFRAFAYAGVYLAYLRRFDEARKELEKSLRLRGEYPMTHHALAYAAREEGKLEEAEAHLRAALAHDEFYVTSRKMLADLCAASGRKDEARELYRRAAAEFPDWKDVRRALEALDA